MQENVMHSIAVSQSTTLMEQAAIALEYWGSNTMWRRLIERDINDDDLEALQFHVDEANAQMNMCTNYDHIFDARYQLMDAIMEAKG